MNRASLFLYFFAIASVTELLALSRGWMAVHQLAKPAIMLGLIGYYLSAVEVRSNSFVRAMFFCLAGDILLLGQGSDQIYFILGLLAFLMGHLLYVQAYHRFRLADTTHALSMPQKIRVSFPIILTGTGLLVVLFPTLGALAVPVLVYSVVLMGMVMAAAFRFGRTSPDSFWLVMGGAILFMASDSMLALNKFYSPFALSGPLVMLTYVLAQYLMVEGVLRHGERE